MLAGMQWFAKQSVDRTLAAGQGALANGRTAGALEAFGRALAQAGAEPDLRARALRGAAEALSAAGLHHEAAERLQALAELQPEDPSVRRALAAALRAAGESPSEVEAWRGLLRLQPDDPKAHERLADLLWSLDRKAEAAPHLRRHAEAKAGRPETWRRLAACARAAGDVDAEISALQSVLRSIPEDAEAHRRLAQLLLDHGAAAEGHLRILTAGGDLQAQEQLAALLCRLGRHHDAVAHLSALAARSPDRKGGWRSLADSLRATGDAAAEVKALDRLLEVDSADSTARERLALLLIQLGRGREAAGHLNRLCQGSPADIELQRRVAAALAQAGDIDGEIAAWRAVIGAEPQDLPAHERLATLLMERGLQGEALPHLRATALAGAARAKPWRRLGEAAAAAGEAAVEAEAWGRLLEVEPAAAAARERLALLLLRLGRHDEAALHLNLLRETFPKDAGLQRRLAGALAEAGDPDGEIAAWHAVAAALPTDLAAHERLAHLLLGRGLQREALPHLRAMARAEPAKPKLWRRLAEAAAAAREPAVEVEGWTRLLEIDAADPAARERLALVLLRLHRGAEAALHLNLLVEACPQDLKLQRRLAGFLAEAGDANGEIAAWRRVLAGQATDLQAHDRLAQLLLGFGRPGEALPHLQALAAAQPAKAKAWRRLAEAAALSEDTAIEAEAWSRLLEIDAGDLPARERLGTLLLRLDRRGEAALHLNRVREAAPHDAKQQRRLAQALAEAGEIDGEIAAWQAVLSAQPADLQAHERVAHLLLGQGRQAEAAAHLEVLAESDPTDLRRWRRAALAWAEAADGRREAAAWERLLRLVPAELTAHQRLALLSAEAGGDPRPHLRAVAQADPQPKTWRRLAEACRKAGDAAGEADALTVLLAATPDNPQLHRRLAQLQLELGRPEEAVGHLRILSDDGDGVASGRLVELLWELGRKAEAAPLLRRFAEAEPERVKPWRRLAEALVAGGDREEELQALDRILMIDSDDRAARSRAADLLEALDRPAEAIPHLRVLADADPDRAKGWRRLALALELTGDIDGEVGAWRRAVAIDDDDLQGHERLAQLLSAREPRADALPHFRAAVRLSPQNARAWRRLVRMLRETGNGGDELSNWREALSLAAQPELEAILSRAETAVQEVKAGRQQLAGVQHELKREQAATRAAVARFEQERESHRSAEAALIAELAERRRLNLDLQESRQRQRQAEAEEAYHLMTVRALSLIEPEADEPSTMRGEDFESFARVALAEAAAQGAVIVAGHQAHLTEGLAAVRPQALSRRLGALADPVVVHAGPAPRRRARGGPPVLGLLELVLRRAAGLADLRTVLPPMDDARRPTRPVMLISSDADLLAASVDAVRAMSDLPFAPAFPVALREAVRLGELQLDDWLGAAWTAAGEPRAMGFRLDPETLALFTAMVRNGRAALLGATFRRARALQLTWSDKGLFAASAYVRRLGGAASDFDAGDAQIQIKDYRRLVGADAVIETALSQLAAGGFRPSLTKVYRELYDQHQLVRFCRDAGIGLDAGRAPVASMLGDFAPGEEVRRIAGLLRTAAGAIAAPEQTGVVTAGLRQFAVGRALEQAGRHADARQAYLQAVSEAPAYFPARAAAARYLELSGDLQAAEACLRLGLKANPGDQSALEALLKFYQGRGLYRKAAAVGRLMQRHGVNRAALMAPMLAELGLYRRAAPLLKSLGARVGPESFLSDLVDLPQVAEQLPALQAAARGPRAQPEARFRLAEALRRLGRLKDALPHYRAALAEPGLLEAMTGVSPACHPRYMVVGPPRTGTTLLRRLFDLHPRIGAPPGELFFFSDRLGERAGSNRRRAPLQWYLEVFRDVASRKPEAELLGEKTPHYFSMAEDEIAFAGLLFPELKVIVTLRDPVVRAWSEIKVQRRMGDAGVVAALSPGRYPNWLAEILEAGRYVRHLRRWLAHLPQDRILLVDSEALETGIEAEAKRIFGWLGVEALPGDQVRALQQGWDNRTENFARSEELAALLRRFYGDEPWRAADVARALSTAAAPARAPRRRAGARTA